MRGGLLLLTFLFVLVGARPGPAAAQGSGTIEGQLKNGTAGAAVPAGLEVVLHSVGDDDRVDRSQARVDAQGRFRFEGLATAATTRYLPTVEYGGALYFPEPVTLADQANKAVEITIYEPTDSDRWIAFERSNLLIQGIGPNRLDLMEMGSLANVGDRTYVGPTGPAGAAKPTLRFSVPSGAFDVTPQAGFAPDDLSMQSNGFTVGSPVVPGRHQLAFSYSLAFDGDRLELTKRLDYPAMGFNVYLPDVGIDVQSPQLKPQGSADLGGQRYLVFSAQALPGGTEIKMRVVGLPSNGPDSQPLIYSLLGLGLVVLGVGVFVVYRRRFLPAPALAAGERGVGDPYDQERLRLLVALARLDERYEQGELSISEYEAQRELGKRRLVALGSARSASERGGS